MTQALFDFRPLDSKQIQNLSAIAPKTNSYTYNSKKESVPHIDKKRRLKLIHEPEATVLKGFGSKRLAHLGALSRLTKGVVGGCFTRNTRIALGNGCDCPSYVLNATVTHF